MASNLNSSSDPAHLMKTTTTLSIAIIMGLVGFAAVAYFLVGQEGGLNPEMDPTFEMLVPGIALLAALGGYFIYGVLLKRASDKSELVDKINAFRIANIVRFSIWDGGGLFCILAFMFTGVSAYLVVALIFIALFVLLFPTKNKVIADLNLSLEEAGQLG